MKIEDMTLKQVKEYCKQHKCDRCNFGNHAYICKFCDEPFLWNLEGEVHDES